MTSSSSIVEDFVAVTSAIDTPAEGGSNLLDRLTLHEERAEAGYGDTMPDNASGNGPLTEGLGAGDRNQSVARGRNRMATGLLSGSTGEPMFQHPNVSQFSRDRLEDLGLPIPQERVGIDGHAFQDHELEAL